MPSDADQAAAFCESGGTVVNASPGEVAAIQQAVSPVYQDLEQDETTKQLVEGIQALKAELPEPPPIASCEPAATGATTPSAGTAAFPDGVYRMEVTAESLMAAGVDRATAFGHAGTWTLTFEDGQFQEGTCVGTYPVQDGRVEIRAGTDPQCGDAAGKVLFSAGWTLEGDQLQFIDVRSGHGSDLLIAALFGGQPFTKID
jgi:hypothetical protein